MTPKSPSVSAQESLKGFIDGQHTDGEEAGEGAFTLDPGKAREKLGRFQLAQPGLYIVKVVQAAVAAGATEIDVKVSRRALTLSFTGPAPESLSPARLSESLLTVHSLPQGALRHLAVAISAGIGAGLQSARWSTPEGSLTVSSSGLELHQNPGPDFCFTVEKSSKLMSWVRGTVFVDEVKALTDHCGWGSCALKLDGRRVEPAGWIIFSGGQCDSLGLWPKEAPSYWEFLKKNLLERHLGQVERHLRGAPATADYKSLEGCDLLLQHDEHHQEHKPWLLWPQAPSDLTALIALTPDLLGIPKVGFVVHGALLQVRKLPDWGHPGALVLVNASEMSTDLSEFAVVQNEVYRETLNRLERSVKETAEGVPASALSSVFAAGGSAVHEHEVKLDMWVSWLREHRLPDNASVTDLIEAFMPNHWVSRFPHSESFEKALRIAHAGHLPTNEPVLIAYSDAVLGESAIGFALTAQRLLWKSSFYEANYLHWSDLDSVDFSLDHDAVMISGGGPSTTLNPHLARCLWGLMDSVKQRLQPSEKSEFASLRSQAMKALGKPTKLYYHPHIPLDKLTAAGAVFGQAVESDEQVVMLYDNTLFGKCDNGVLLTLKRICWCNLMEESVSFCWSELVAGEIEKMNGGLKIKDRELHLNTTEIRDGLFELISARLG